MKCLAYVLAVAACSGAPTVDSQGQGGDASVSVDIDANVMPVMPDALISLDSTPGVYRRACDGSGGVALDFTHFINFADDDQFVRVYTRGADGPPTAETDINASLGTTANSEADLEDATRVGNRIYVISSHGRDKDGVLQATRYRMFALDVAGSAFTVVGPSNHVLSDLLVATNWDVPNTAIITALSNASRLDQSSVASLAPEVNGLNIEGLAGVNGRLLIGFRNPQASTHGLVVTMTNPDAVLSGATAHFGEAIELNLGGLGIRSMTWSASLGAVLVIAGPHDGNGAFHLYKWSGNATDAPVLVRDLPSTSVSHPEAVISYPGTKDVQILYDAGDATIGSSTCKKAQVGARLFTDAILHLQ